MLHSEIYLSQEEGNHLVSFEDKMVGFIGEFLGSKEKNNRKVGLLLMATAGIFLTLGNVLVQFVYKKTKIISSFEILFIRSLIQLLFCALFMVCRKVHLYGNKKRNLFLLFSMGLAEVAAIIFFYLALRKIPVADATVIQFTSPIFTVLFSFVFLRKGCGIIECVCGLVSFVGVIIIAKPDLLFPQKFHGSVHTHQLNIAQANHTILETLNDVKYVTGSCFALIAAMCLSIFFILNKLNGTINVALTVFYPSLIGVIVSPIAMGIQKEQFLIGEIDGKFWGILVTVGFVSFIGMMFMGEALQLEDAGPAILIRNCDVIYAYILQYLLMHHPPSVSALIGTVVVLTASSILALTRAFDVQKLCCGKCCGGKCSGESNDEYNDENRPFIMQDYDSEDEINLLNDKRTS